ncbi:YMGG-like glycine zipper-containing protein [Candidatus Igneacidithiobacillus taiwanensis]|uniref:YMGG-like glycine zipper-containing protein n=1 Tax=Candidatus Igneacidithiobacillus taiwanensis TaxID=1945924 RepID=UPI0028A0085A|nr:glycine zipper family protein [Candidatus Igneacidithiobacillus taiwanensis]
MRYPRLIIAFLIPLFLTGCASLNNTQQRALTGGAIGATGGAIIGATMGAPAVGAAIGGATGAAAGVIIPQLGHDAIRLLGGN